MTPEMTQRLNNVLRIAKAVGWDEWGQEVTTEGIRLKLRPAGQLGSPEVISAAVTQLGYALAPYQTRMVNYLPSNAGGPEVVMLIPENPQIISARG